MVLASAGCTFALLVPFLADIAFDFDGIRQAALLKVFGDVGICTTHVISVVESCVRMFLSWVF